MILFLFAILLSTVNSEKELLKQGLELQEQQKYEEALQVWSDAFTVLDEPSLAIAHAFLNLSTREGLTSYYETGSQLYLWALSGDQLYGDSEIWEKEVRWLSPLLEGDEKARFEELLKNNDRDLALTIAGFWNRIDPTPGTRYNERLIEHWERITYAQKNFTMNNNSVYGTDDRGTDYVRYGAPDFKHTGMLYADATSIWEMANSIGRVNAELAIPIVQQFDPTPEYEIWIYNRFNTSMSDNLVLIFGDAALQGYKKVDVIDEFIPRSVFSLSNRFDLVSLSGRRSFGSVSPGMVLQWIYYNQLANIDGLFARQVAHIMQEWTGPRAILGKAQGPILQQKVKNEVITNLQDTPEERSTETEKIAELPVVVHQYRFLDPGLRPFTAFFVGSDPFDAYVNDLAVNDELMMPDSTEDSYMQAYGYYRLAHGIRILDDDGSILNQSRMPLKMVVRDSEEVQNYSVFTIPWTEQLSIVKAYAELENTYEESRRKDSSTVFRPALRGLGVKDVEISDPIPVEESELALSDIVFGYDMDTEAGQTLFPFNVSHDRILPSGKAMALHLEVYNLSTDTNNRGQFNLEYEITQDRRFNWLLGDKSSTSLQVLYENTGSRFADNLEIQTRELEAGEYELHLRINDLLGDRRIETTIPFTVIQ